jgi:hypothetical protein
MLFRKLSADEIAYVESTIQKGRMIDLPEGQSFSDPKRQAYNRWHKMMRRCYNDADQAFKNYGGRGIKVCAAWHDFETYFKESGRPPEPTYTLDRIDNDGDYCPDNVRWASKAQQAINRRKCAKPKPSFISIRGRHRAHVRISIARTFDTLEEAKAWAETVGERIAAETRS